MKEQPIPERGKGFLKNDRALVCSMLAVYGICILGLVAAVYWGLDQRQRNISANATSTAVAISTQQASGTATAMAHAEELEKYEFIDRFDTNRNDWMMGPESNEYWIGKSTIEDGIYLWDITKVKKPFLYWADCSNNKVVKDFDAYVDSKILESTSKNVCSGLIFRRSRRGWDHGGYAFMVCNSGFFNVSYHGQEGWQDISGWLYRSEIYTSDWNRIEVSARGNRLTFRVNNTAVYDVTDERQKEGDMAIFVQVEDLEPAKVVFDNFGVQSR